MPALPLPVVRELADVYSPSALAVQTARWAALRAAFVSSFGSACTAIARAPGRVNVLGEHIDYAGFSVLPTAVSRDLLIACGTHGETAGSTTVHLRNLDPAYDAVSFEVNLRGDGSELAMNGEHHWSAYFRAGLKGILAQFAELDSPTPKTTMPATLNLLVTGSVPAGSGLSSSAAMTTASVIVSLFATGRLDQVRRREITNCAIVSERWVGVNSGGMDQSASVFSQPNSLLHVSFVPNLEARAIQIPKTSPALSFVIANTLIVANKVETGKFNYNLRVVETRIGALLLAKYLKQPVVISPTNPMTFKSVLDSYFDSFRQLLGTPIPELPEAEQLGVILDLARVALGAKEEGMTWAEVYAQLGVGEDVVQRDVVGAFEVEPRDGKLQIWKRARHVLSEARRVYQFIDLLESSSSPERTPTEMGILMNASHKSCDEDFNCACPELNELCVLASQNGAYGSRLTGAGWGGATVHLVQEEKVGQFIQALREGYYKKRFPDLSEAELDDVCFDSKSERGALLYLE